MNRLSGLFAAAIVSLAALSSSGCIYAPFDLGLDNLGKVQEVTLVDAKTDDKILMIRVDGEITDFGGDSDSLFGGSEPTTAQVMDALDIARREDNLKNIKAVILRINSPGGGVTASDIIYRELAKFRAETKIPVIALFMDVAASGGYYIAQACDRIVAHPTCVTGSIGVIATIPNVSGLLGKIGVTVHTFKKGKDKDTGSPFREMTDQDRKVFEGLLDDMYAKFVSIVATGRKVPEAAVRDTEARVLTANEAKKLKLIDEIGYFDDAVRVAKQLGNIKDARIVTYERKGIGTGRRTIYSSTFVDPIGANAVAALGGKTERNIVKLDAGASSQSTRWPVFKFMWQPTLE
jgi:protease-4